MSEQETTGEPRRGGVRVSWKLVMGGLVVVTLLAAVAAFVLYEEYVQYDRIAALHLPPDTTAAVRVDVERVELYEPVRKHLLPLLDDSFGGAPAGPGSLPARLERIRVRTGVDLAIDLREIVVARGPGWNDWVVVISGKFPHHGVVAGMAHVLSEEGASWKLSANRQELLGPRGRALGQAGDGSVILASDRARLERALPRGETYRRLGLDDQTPVSAAAGGAMVRSYASSPARFVAPSLRELQAVDRLSASARLGHPLQVTLHVDLRSDRSAEAMQKPLSELLGGLVRVSALVPGQDFAGERAALGRARTAVAGPHRLDVLFDWKPDEVDRGAASLARAVRSWDGAHAGQH